MFLFALYLLLMPFQDHPKFGKALLKLGFLTITPVKLVGMAVILTALLMPRPAGAAPRLRSLIPWVYTVFALIPIFCTLAFGNPLPQFSLSAYVSFAILLIAVRLLICTADRARTVVRMVVLSEALSTLWVFKQYFLLHWPRPNGPSSDSNYEAMALVMAVPLAVWLFHYDKSKFWRLLAGGAFPTLAFAVLVTQSRGGFFALIVVSAALWLKSKRKLAALVVLGITLGLLAKFAPQGMWDRLHQIKVTGQARTGAEESTRSRIESWRAGLRMMKAHPISGVGLDRFAAVAHDYNHAAGHQIAHNTYVQIGGEGGLPALALFVAILGLASRSLRKSERLASDANEEWSVLARMMRLGLLAYTVAAFFVSAQLVKEYWTYVFLSLSVRDIIAAQARLRAPNLAPASAGRLDARSAREYAAQPPPRPLPAGSQPWGVRHAAT